jgi:hypothetical protein
VLLVVEPNLFTIGIISYWKPKWFL